MEGDPPIEEDEEPKSEFVGGFELPFGRGRSGYKDVYPHRKGWQAKVFVEDKGVCSLGIFKDKKQAAIAVARAKAAGLYLLPSPDKTRAKPGCGSACTNPALCLPIPFRVFSQAAAARLMLHSKTEVYIDASEPTDFLNGIIRKLFDPACNGPSTAPRIGCMHASLHGRCAGNACAARGCTRTDPTDPAAAASQSPPRWGLPPRPLDRFEAARWSLERSSREALAHGTLTDTV